MPLERGIPCRCFENPKCMFPSSSTSSGRSAPDKDPRLPVLVHCVVTVGDHSVFSIFIVVNEYSP